MLRLLIKTSWIRYCLVIELVDQERVDKQSILRGLKNSVKEQWNIFLWKLIPI